MPIFASALHLAHLSAPAAPPAGSTGVFARSGDLLYSEDAAGNERLVAAGPTPVRLTSTAATSSTTVSDVPGLALAVSAGRYLFRFAGQYVSVVSTTGLGLTVNGPALGTEGLAASVMIAHTNAVPMLGVISAYNTVVLGTTSSTATRMPWEVWGHVHVSAAGTLRLGFRSEINASAVTLQIGSYGYAWAIS